MEGLVGPGPGNDLGASLSCIYSTARSLKLPLLLLAESAVPWMRTLGCLGLGVKGALTLALIYFYSLCMSCVYRPGRSHEQLKFPENVFKFSTFPSLVIINVAAIVRKLICLFLFVVASDFGQTWIQHS